jgi:hypothetical protein
MNTCTRIGLLIALLLMCVILAGCPGMPGAAGGKGASSQLPPGLQPPPGVQSGGARTLMGTTITAPDNSILVVKFAATPLAAYVQNRSVSSPAQFGVPTPTWQSCRRVIPMDSYVLLEGLNYDGRAQGVEEDVNQLIPVLGLEYFYWKYEPKPLPGQPAGKTGPGQQRGRAAEPAGPARGRAPERAPTSRPGSSR